MKSNPLTIIKKRATLFRSLTGLPEDKFNELLQQVEPLYEQAEQKRLFKEKRKRKQGGGRQKLCHFFTASPISLSPLHNYLNLVRSTWFIVISL